MIMSVTEHSRRPSIFTLTGPGDWTIVVPGVLSVLAGLAALSGVLMGDSPVWAVAVGVAVTFVFWAGVLMVIRATVRLLKGDRWQPPHARRPIVRVRNGGREVEALGGVVTFFRDERGATKASVRGVARDRHSQAITVARAHLVRWQEQTGAEVWIKH
ncbi:MAG: hypothetical protein FWF90_13295 [Promicromonosporaceae bacterium]|nr:hypothetical protein [Promicromonosporaceae bacterium]